MIVELESGLTMDLTKEQYEQHILNRFIEKFGEEITTEQLSNWQRIKKHNIYLYRSRENDPLKTGSKLCTFNIRESNDWFRRNKLGLYKDQARIKVV